MWQSNMIKPVNKSIKCMKSISEEMVCHKINSILKYSQEVVLNTRTNQILGKSDTMVNPYPNINNVCSSCMANT